MIDIFHLRNTVVPALSAYLSSEYKSSGGWGMNKNVPVIKGNQNKKPPKYPYVSYNIPTLASANNGTWGEWEDGIARNAVTQTWSIKALSDNEDEALIMANRAREWLQHVGRVYLNDNKVIVQSVTNITDRSNILTVEYEYAYGFDVVFWLYDEVSNPIEETGFIETIEFNK